MTSMAPQCLLLRIADTPGSLPLFPPVDDMAALLQDRNDSVVMVPRSEDIKGETSKTTPSREDQADLGQTGPAQEAHFP